MNGIEKIIQRIDADAQAEIDALLAKAKQEADAIAAGFAKQAQQDRQSLDQTHRQSAQEREESLVAVAQLESRKVALGAKQTMVEQAFALALEQLCSLPNEQYVELASRLLAKAAPDGEGTVVFSEKDKAAIGTAVVEAANKLLGSGKLQLAEETRPMDGGFILLSRQVEVNATFPTLVRLQRNQCAGEVARCLFPGE